jgi:membrane protein DedA with SNARE-associated domain
MFSGCLLWCLIFFLAAVAVGGLVWFFPADAFSKAPSCAGGFVISYLGGNSPAFVQDVWGVAKKEHPQNVKCGRIVPGGTISSVD